MRVQFTVNNDEYQELQRLANSFGSPDVSSYCKDVSLQVRTYADMWQSVISQIKNMPSGTTFALRDLIDVPPANMGVKLFNSQKDLGIVVSQKKDSLKTNTFTKL